MVGGDTEKLEKEEVEEVEVVVAAAAEAGGISRPCNEYYLLPAGGTTWSRSLGLVRFQIRLMTALNSSLA